MKLRGCSISHFIWTVQDGMMKKVHNTNSHGRPDLKFKKLEDIYRSADAEYTSKFQDDYAGTECDGSSAENDFTPLSFAQRKTQAGNCYTVEEEEPECPSYENKYEELTLSQLKKKCKRKKRKASESVLLTPKVEEDDSDLGEPLCKFMFKVSKSSKSKTRPANGSFSMSSRSTPLVTSELSAGADALLFSKDLATVNVKLEAPEVENFECREMTLLADDPLNCNEPVNFAFESGFIAVSNETESMKSGSLTNEREIDLNGVSLDNLDEVKNTFLVPSMGGENMELDNEENIANTGLPLSLSEVDKEEYVSHNQPPSNVSCMEDDSSVEDLTPSTSDCSQSHPYLQQAPEQVNYIPDAQESDLTFNDDHHCVELGQVSDSYMVEECAESSAINQEYGSPNVTPDYLCLPWKTHSWPSGSDDEDYVVSADAKSPISEEKQLLTSVNADADSNSLNSDNNTVVAEDTPILHDQPSFVPADADSEVMFSNHNQTDITREATEIRNFHCLELRHPERLPSTRKAISPTSQEKLCLAMKSAELLDDMDRYKCKEKLYFEEQADNKLSSTTSDVEDNEPNIHPQQATQLMQNKVIISPKHMLRRLKNFKKGSPPKKCDAPKGVLDGPRLCRSLPRLSTGCTSIQGCSESAVAFSQRQMQDIESLASKLMNELNSMKVIMGEKMLYEAHRSTSLKNEADEVKSAIKSATKTEETARKWLSMMARDCNRFCKIMKLKEDNTTSAASDAGVGVGVGCTNQEKKEGKKISFADEAGGTLCDVKFFQIDGASSEPL